MRTALLLALALASAGTAAAQTGATSRLFVERPSSDGVPGVRLIRAPARLSPGQPVVVLVNYTTGQATDPASVVSAVPAALRFDRAGGGAELSVDGGRRFGRLASLSSPDGSRPAQPSDVTHIRWRIAPAARPPVLSFRGTVR